MDIKTDSKMIRNSIILSLCVLMILSISCRKESPMINMSSSNDDEVVTFFAGENEVSVLIFQKDANNIYKYVRSISSGWVNNRVSTNLEIGNYKFLFIKAPGLSTSNYPDNLDRTVPFDSIKFISVNDPQNNGCVLPVDEIWLPKTYTMANQNYDISGPRVIQNTLNRAVSQVVLKLKRASYEGGVLIDSLPYENGENIMQHIKEVKLDISGIGKYITVEGAKESARTIQTLTQATNITPEGFADFTGPFVFPTSTSADANINITITPKPDSPFEPMSTSVQGAITRNKRLEITIWLTSTYRFIGVDVEIEPITDTTDGDTGMWQ